MLSITQFPRRFATANKRILGTSAPMTISSSSTSSSIFNSPLTSCATSKFTCVSADIPAFRATLNSMHGLSIQSIQSRSIYTKVGDQQQFTTAAAITVDEAIDDNDAYLYGERPDSWYTTDRNPRTDLNFPGRSQETGRLSSIAMPNLKTISRQDFLDYFDNTWALTDALFAKLQGTEAFITPPPHHLRHPLIFYYGHPTVFYVNKMLVAGLLDKPVNPYFEEIFEVGVDEMRWDDMSKNEMSWPSVKEVTAYRRDIYRLVKSMLENHPELADGHNQITEDSPLWGICMALEHERIHLETSSMLMLEHPTNFFKTHADSESSPLLPKYHDSLLERKNSPSNPVRDVDFPANNLIPMEKSVVSIGKPRDFPSFGWDNEYGSKQVNVSDCEVSQFLISNGEFLEFVKDEGYLTQEYWSATGWEWRCFKNTKWPNFWCQNGPNGSHLYQQRALFDIVPMQWDWPVQVNYHEAKAFCAWKTAKEGNGQYVYHITTEAIHQMIRDPVDQSASLQVDAIMEIPRNLTMAQANRRNNNISYLSNSPVNAFPPTSKGFYDVMGNAWEWCEDHFSALPGFQLHSYYDDFSAPCFDGEHQVIMGGSFISSGDNGGTKFCRYHFRPHFFQHAGFRIVKKPLLDNANENKKTYRLETTCINAPGPYVKKTTPFRSSEIMEWQNGMELIPLSDASTSLQTTVENITNTCVTSILDLARFAPISEGQLKADIEMYVSGIQHDLNFQGTNGMKYQIHIGGKVNENEYSIINEKEVVIARPKDNQTYEIKVDKAMLLQKK